MLKFHFLFILLWTAISMGYTLPAFPGAEGWGSQTPGGRGGKVYIVTNNNVSGPGSFYEALRATEPRIIVFQISGIINLPDYYDIVRNDFCYEEGAKRSYVTIAGQTSPGGITITAGTNDDVLFMYQSEWSNFVIRFVRFKDKTNVSDVVELNKCDNFIFDHCDFAGGTDECFSLTECHHFSIQWCCIANSHASSDQQYGSLFAYLPTSHISMHHNIWAHFKKRFPQMHWNDGQPPENGLIDYRNNLCYNYEGWAFHANYAEDTIDINFIGNNFKEGQNTSGASTNFPVVHLYDEDNRLITSQGTISTNIANNWLSKAWQAFLMPAITTHSSAEAYDLVLKKTGAWPRDSMISRTINDIIRGTGGYGNLSEEFITTGPQTPDDSDYDGMPDFWEQAMGFNPNNADDNIDDHDNDGYTNVEEFINDLALARLCEEYYNPVYPIPANWSDFDPSCSLKVVGINNATVNSLPTVKFDIQYYPFSTSGKGVFKLNPTYEWNYSSTLHIINTRGQVIKTLQAYNTVEWDGKSNEGKIISSGIYVMRWRTDRKILCQKKFIIIH